jgi:hypothetical protein
MAEAVHSLTAFVHLDHEVEALHGRTDSELRLFVKAIGGW